MRRVLLSLVTIAALVSIGDTAAQAEWAIAVGQEGGTAYSYGIAYGFATSSEALRVALFDCRAEGRACQIVATGFGHCTAIAFGRVDNGYGWSVDDDRQAASDRAVAQCQKFTDGGCKVQGAFCDDE